MFIELTDEWGGKVLLNTDNVRLITEASVIQYNSGYNGSDTIKVKESYNEIKLKMAGR